MLGLGKDCHAVSNCIAMLIVTCHGGLSFLLQNMNVTISGRCDIVLGDLPVPSKGASLNFSTVSNLTNLVGKALAADIDDVYPGGFMQHVSQMTSQSQSNFAVRRRSRALLQDAQSSW
jgi:hypothetical protein